ncbi:Ribonucleases P/MRP protein subunit POP1 [Psilocybe cubensis]|uniref:Ribonucleases P/MRP protein subunit POP1 n=2 Tax=Psilocybe cubensis TaxID=181762 RepID=A0ACB8GYF1_PSICU|nr:Ribonucleases P/MRP protein subunit POP1 [Psilocybe cubensis]KAH9480457.1 Ribonucleases P/MRP protein subunit POP1 [Psilocybe cubensis]
MPPKRRNGEDADAITGREKKKLKINAARTIAVQPSSQRESSAAIGPSNSATNHSNSLTGLPTALDVEKFVEARAFEIDAMHTAMKTASASSTHRVWQTLPRHLRRRAASHDVRRVPLKLRDRARAEMDPVRKKALGRSLPKLGKGKGMSRTEAFLRRQRDKAWLETHIWHAKRMHMENMWGYRLAVTPTEKSYRPSHRASVHGSILHDASYYSTYEIKGPEEALIALLDLCCDPQGPGPSSKRYLNGSRILETSMYAVGLYPYGLIAPVTIIWRPYLQASSAINTTGSSGNEGVKDVRAADIRSVWLRFHPSVQTAVFNTLKDATSRSLTLYKARHSEEALVEVIDIKRQLNIFEIMGPKSSQVIKGALTPIVSEKSREFLQFWKSLAELQSSGSVPRGMIVGFKVNDPRLNFPPKNAKPATIPSKGVPSIEITFPSANLANSEIWEESMRNSLSKPRYKKKDIDTRRANSDIPGSALKALRQDDCIPILLIQRSVETPNSSGSKGLHGWTLILPAGWSMAFFSSLIYTSTRVAGQQERQTQAYEAGTTYFPRDYPTTEPYQAYAQDREFKEKETWDRKPPAKRVNFEKLGTENPWMSDWAKVLGIPGRDDKDEDFVATQREPEPSQDNEAHIAIKPWLLRGSEVPSILSKLSSVFNVGAALLSEINRLRLKRSHQVLAEDITGAQLLHGALVNVEITMCSRGSPQDLAEIFIIPDGLSIQWERFLQTRNRKSVDDEEHPDELELASHIPPKSSIVGHVTTGHYSLARGEGFAIGAIALARLMELEQQARR